jgi:hypothetical protein
MAHNSKGNLLNTQHYDVLNQVLAECNRIQEILEAMERAGVGSEELKIHNQQTAQIAANLKKEFFPNNP